MIKNSKRFKTVIALFVIILLVAYAFVIFLPHECPEAECTLCHTVDSSKEITVGVLLSAAYFVAVLAQVISMARERAVLFCDGTPVGLKVKLSH